MPDPVTTTLVEAWGPIGAVFVLMAAAIGVLWRELVRTNARLIDKLEKLAPALEANTTALNEQRKQLEKATEHLEGRRKP